MWLLYLAVAAEIAIWAYVIHFVVRYCIPWAELRRKRELREAVRLRIIEDRRRIEGLRLMAMAGRWRGRRGWALTTSVNITADCLRLLDACGRSLAAAEKYVRPEPDGSAQIESDVRSTLGCIGRMLELRDRDIPLILREQRQTAEFLLDRASRLRDDVATEIAALVRDGLRCDDETRRIAMLATAIEATRGLAASDPDAAMRMAARQIARIRELYGAALMRSVFDARVRDVIDGLDERVQRLRLLRDTAVPVLGSPRTARNEDWIDAMAVVRRFDAMLETAGNSARTAQALRGESEGEPADAPDAPGLLKLSEALAQAERADALLRHMESSLRGIMPERSV